MNVDFRFLRQSAFGVCGVALLGLLFGGCVSLHKPRFWDKDDVTTASTSGDSGSQKSKKPSTDPAADAKAAPTVVAADHSTSDDPSGHVSVFDLSESSPTASSRQIGTASDPQRAPKSSSPASGSKDDPFAPAVAQSSAVGGPANTPHPAPIATASAVQTKELDPFAETAQPFVPPAAVVDATRAPAAPSARDAKGPDAFADLGGSASGDVHAPLAQPESQPLAKPASAPIQPEAIEPSSATPQPPAPPQPAVSSSPAVPKQPAASEPPSSPETLPAMPADPQPASATSLHDQTATAAPVEHKQEVADDAFAVPAPIRPPQTRQPAVSRDVAQSRPSCAAPENRTATADKTVAAPTAMAAAAPPAKPAVSEAWATVPAPPSSEQVTSTNALDASPETSKPVIRRTARPAVPKVEPVPAAEESVAQHEETIRRHEPTPPPAVRTTASEGAGVSNPMICDSNSVRGKFTGADAPAAKAVHQSPPKETQSKPSSNGVPMSCTDGDPFCTRAGQDEDASSGSANGPKPLGRVVNAVAHRIGKASVADPFALEQAVDTSAVDPISIGDGRTQTPNVQGPRPLSAEQTGDGSASAELMAANTTVASDPPRDETRINRETWFGVGIGVGLAASLALWLRSRPKNQRVLNG